MLNAPPLELLRQHWKPIVFFVMLLLMTAF